MRFIVATPPTEPFAVIPGGPNVAVSPDGRRIVYHVAQGTAFPLYLRSTDQLDARPISGADVAASPFFSPDSEWFGFYSLRDRTLKKIAVAGGPPTTLVPSTAMAGASWGDDGNIVFAEASVTGGLFRVSASGGKPERITTVDPQNRETDHTSPHVLPGSRAVVFTVRTGADLRLARIAVLDLQTGEKKVLVDGGFNAYYAPTGHLLYAQASTLMAVPFDLDRLTVTGAPTTIQEGIGTKASGVANYAVSGTGMFVYAPGGIGGAKARPVWVGRDGREIAALVAADLDAPQFPRISPDGRKLSLVIAGDLWVYDLEGRPPIKLTFDGSSFAAAWSPDGKTLVYESASGSLASIPADGSGRTPEQVSPEGHFHPHGWSPDGREIIAVQIGSAMLSNIVKFPPAAKGELQQVVQTESEEGSLGATLSHDGRWLAYTSDVTGRMEIWVRPFPGPGAPIRISPNGGIEPVWARNDRELYYLEGENVMAAAVTTQPAFNFKAPVALFAGRYARGGQPPSYAVAPDGRFLMIKSSDAQATSAHMVVVLNWLEELTRRVPGK
jgi:serine/threonine-protein kinase